MSLRVKEICKEKGITMEQLASVLNITPNTLTRNINGNPTIETLQKIADALEVAISDLFAIPKTNTIHCPNCGVELHLTSEKKV